MRLDDLWNLSSDDRRSIARITFDDLLGVLGDAVTCNQCDGLGASVLVSTKRPNVLRMNLEHPIECPTCGGSGRDPERVAAVLTALFPCPTCKGSGEDGTDAVFGAMIPVLCESCVGGLDVAAVMQTIGGHAATSWFCKEHDGHADDCGCGSYSVWVVAEGGTQ